MSANNDGGPAFPSSFSFGDLVTKRTGSEWSGRVCGFYSTALTPDGVCVESGKHAGSVQIYPAKALEAVIHADKTQGGLGFACFAPNISTNATCRS